MAFVLPEGPGLSYKTDLPQAQERAHEVPEGSFDGYVVVPPSEEITRRKEEHDVDIAGVPCRRIHP